MLLKGSQHVNLLGPGAGGANHGAGAYLVLRGGRDPALLLSPGGRGPMQRYPAGVGLLGRPRLAGCSGVLLPGRLWPRGRPTQGLRVDGISLEPGGLAAFLLGGTLVLSSPRALREARSSFHSLWCRLFP